jgi:hypothetical protein
VVAGNNLVQLNMERVKIMLSADAMLKSTVRFYDNWVVTRNDSMQDKKKKKKFKHGCN